MISRRILLLPLLLLATDVASAHVHLHSSRPADGDTLQTSPQEVRLEFSGAVVVQYTTATLVGPDGGQIATPDLEVVPDTGRREFAMPIERRLTRGEYAVNWRTTAADGHVMQGTITFFLDVEEEVPEPPVGDTEELPRPEAIEEARPTLASAGPISTIARFLHYLALLSLLGTLAFHYGVVGRMHRDPRVAARADAARRRTASLLTWATVLLAIVVPIRLWVQSAQLHGVERSLDLQSIGVMLTHTIPGQAWVLQVIGLVVLVVGLILVRQAVTGSTGWIVVGVAVLALTIVPALSGHAAAVENLTALAVSIHALHVVGAGVWLGTLAVLLLVGLPLAAGARAGERMRTLAATISLFSPVALGGVALAGVTGIINAVFHLTAVSDLWQTDYGVGLLVKLGALAVAMALGFYHWRAVLPRLEEEDSPARFRRTAGAELFFGVLVLLATAAFVGMPTPY